MERTLPRGRLVLREAVRDGERYAWYWTLYSANGNIIADGGGYNRKPQAKKLAKMISDTIISARVEVQHG